MKITGKKILSTFFIGVLGGAFSLGAFLLMSRGHIDYKPAEKMNLPVRYVSNAYGGGITGPDFVMAAQKSVHAVVHIKTEYQQKNNYYDEFFGLDPFFNFFRNDPRERFPLVAAGSGVIISENGYIVTNNHVVQNADLITVTLNDKRTYEAKVVGSDPMTDLALIKIEEKGLPYLQYGNSDEVQVGEWVLAVGNPFNLNSTVTAGIVSAKARDIQILGDMSSVESFIQTDAAVNPGNSGGALVNTEGNLIGVNAAIATNTGSYTGYSFAIPSNLVQKVINDLIEYGEVQRAYLGLFLSDVDSKLAKDKGFSDLNGVYVESVIENAAADKAGIKPGDLILKIGDINTTSKSELNEIIARHHPGDKVSLALERNGNKQVVEVELMNKEGSTGILKTDPVAAVSELGADFEACSPGELNALRIDHGIKVVRLKKGKLASVGVKEGFIIMYIDNKPVKTVQDISKMIEGKNRTIQMEGIYKNGMRAYYGFGL